MSTKLFVALLGLLSVVVSSAATPEVFSQKGKYGLQDPQTGKVVLKAKYDSIYNFRGDYALIRKGNKFGLVKSDGEIYLSCRYSKILLPKMGRSGGQDYFWTSRDGKTFIMESSSNYYTSPYYNVFYGPDKEWYAMNPTGLWVNIVSTGGYRHAGFKGGAPQITKISKDYTLFNGNLYDSEGSIVLNGVESAKKTTVGEADFIEINRSDKSTNLIEPRQKGVWRKSSPGLDGVYSMESGSPGYKLKIHGQRVYRLMPFDVGDKLSISIDSKSGLWGLVGPSGTILKHRYDYIKVDKKAGRLNGEDFWIVRLDTKSPVFEDELEPLVSVLRKGHESFVIVTENLHQGKSLFGNTGAELVRNKLDKVYVKDGFMIVEADGAKKLMGMNGSTDFSNYDAVWRADGGNMYGSDVIVKKNGRLGLYSEGTGELIPPKYDAFKRLSNHIYVYDGDRVGLYDNAGNKILDPKYRSIKVGAVYLKDRNYYFVTTPGGASMIVDHKGRTVLPAGLIDKVDFLSGDEGQWCKVYKKGRMGILNLKTFKIAVPCAYEDNIFFGSGQWPNRRLGVYKSSAQQELIEIWTFGGQKIASKVFPSSSRYMMRAYLESQLNARFHY